MSKTHYHFLLIKMHHVWVLVMLLKLIIATNTSTVVGGKEATVPWGVGGTFTLGGWTTAPWI